ncbi:MAG: glycosyltransferase [Pseudomonadota bacterium]|nr:glycosyltransferase [Pseudomonadota bacterium]
MNASRSFGAVLPNYNDAASLERSLDSLIRQTVPFNRIIVVNDGSTDNSLEILERYKKTVPYLTVIDNGGNLGMIPSVNRGLAAAQEDYVFLASANDHYNRVSVELAKKAIENAPEVGLIAGKVILHEVSTSRQRELEPPLPQKSAAYSPSAYRDILRQRNFSFYGGSVFVHRQYALSAGGFREAMKWHADWLLFALLASRHGFAYVPEAFGTICVSPNQYSSAMFDWAKQSAVIESYITLLKKEYPNYYPLFRSMGLLPSYDTEALGKLMASPELRPYVTPLLLWRLTFYKTARMGGRLLPYRLREQLRRYVRL